MRTFPIDAIDATQYLCNTYKCLTGEKLAAKMAAEITSAAISGKSK
jgi:hypothetical protein